MRAILDFRVRLGDVLAGLAAALLLAGLSAFGLREVRAAAQTVQPPDAMVIRAAQTHGVAFIGDSRVAMLPTSLAADDSENFGLNGETTAHLVERLRAMDLSHARAIVVEIGVDDWYEPGRFAGFEARYAAILSELPPSAPVVAAAILPVDSDRVLAAYHGAFDLHGVEPAVAEANRVIAALCRARPGCTFLPVPPLLDGGSLPTAYSFDGVHLNAAGAAIWAGAIRDGLSRTADRASPPRPT